ncbi:tubulin-folding cofactor B [Lingula anatina]|uniref:Tubulin-folding cofactor B n=1 Tax=Lingula anatina TaxID=7574 RepID=A0A1S3K4I3_LINAN|nr:tubulin-folding cofactor B [Lingula anatina]|eukprot:XP_013417540.1 tubulin-folding cofactor B [Lingula anatina]
MSEQYSVVTQSVVNVTVSSNINSFGTERRFPKDIPIAELKMKLELLTGASSATMKLEAYDKDDKLVCAMDNDAAMLGSYPVDDGMRIHVKDTAHTVGEFEDVSKVEKFELTEEEYANRTDSVRAFKQRMKLGRFQDVDPEVAKKQEEEKKEKEKKEKEKADSMKVGDRCEVKLANQMAKRGIVQYVGTTDFKPGYWVGVQYDEPYGKHNGTVNGKQYFQCPDKYGAFVKPENVEVGDFPEEDLGFEDDEM